MNKDLKHKPLSKKILFTILKYAIGWVPKEKRKEAPLREVTKTWATRFLVFVLALSILPLALGDYFFKYSMKSDTFIKVGKISVPNSVVLKEYADFQRRYQAQDLANPWIMQLFYREIVKIARDMLFVNEANTLHIGISKDILYGMIASSSDFQRVDGSFNQALFNRWVMQNYTGVRAYLLIMGNNLKKEQLLGSIALPIQPRTLENDILSTVHQKRDVTYTAINAADMPEGEKPTKEQLVAYLEQNNNRYQEPEYRAGEILIFDPSSITVSVSPTEIEEMYENNKALYAEPVKRHIVHAVFQSKADAEKAYTLLSKSPTDKSIETIDLGFVAAGDLPEDMAQQAFKMPIGAFQPPIETSIGYDIIKVVAQQSPKILPLKEVRTEIMLDIKQQKEDSITNKTIIDIEDKIFLGTTFSDIAKDTKGVHVMTIPPITKAERLQNGTLLKASTGIDRDIIALMYAKGGKTGTELQPYPKDKKLLYSLKLTTVIPEKLPLYETIEKTLRDDYSMDQKRKKAYAKVLDMQKNIKGGKESINNYKPKKARLTRNVDHAELPESLISALFFNPLDLPMIGETPTGYVVAVATHAHKGAKPTNLTLDTLGYKGVMEINNSFMETYLSILEKKYPIKINQQELMRTFMPQEAENADKKI